MSAPDLSELENLHENGEMFTDVTGARDIGPGIQEPEEPLAQ